MTPGAPAVTHNETESAVRAPASVPPTIERRNPTAMAGLSNRSIGTVLQGLDQGRPLPAHVRHGLEAYFRQDLGDIRVHDGHLAAMLARRIDARAFTVGDHLVIGDAVGRPETPEGQELLAHEVAHALQQRQSGLAIDRAAVGTPDAGPKEKHARQAGKRLVKAYQFTVDGKTVTLDEAAYQKELARATKNLAIRFNTVERTAQGFRENQQDFLKNVHNWAGTISDWLGDASPPDLSIWSWPNAAIKNGRQALADGHLESAAKQLQLAQDAFRDAQHEWNTYIEKTTGGAQTAITTLEYTRDISFAVAIAAAAIVAAPVVAGAVGSTAIAGGIVTLGGGVVGAGLRVGGEAAGEGLAYGHVSGAELRKAAAEGFDLGTTAAGIGFGFAGSLGKTAVQQGAKVLAKEGAKALVKEAAIQGTVGAITSGTSTAIRGGSGTDVLKAAGIGFASAGAGSALGGVGTKVLGKTTSAQLITAMGSGVGGAVTAGLLQGQGLKDMAKTSGKEGAKAFLIAAVTHGAGAYAGRRGVAPPTTVTEEGAPPATPVPAEPAVPPATGGTAEPGTDAPTASATESVAAPAPPAAVRMPSPELQPSAAAAASEVTPAAPAAEAPPASGVEAPEPAPTPVTAAPGGEGPTAPVTEATPATVPVTAQPVEPPAAQAGPEPAGPAPAEAATPESVAAEPETAEVAPPEPSQAQAPSPTQVGPAGPAAAQKTGAPSATPPTTAPPLEETFATPPGADEVGKAMEGWKLDLEEPLPPAPSGPGVEWGGTPPAKATAEPAAAPTTGPPSESAAEARGKPVGAAKKPPASPPPKLGHVLEGYPPEHVEMPWEPGTKSTSEQGYRRDADYFWKEYESRWGEQLSGPDNVALRKAGKSPIVDETWIKFHPEHAPYEGQTLIHHHIGEGGTAVALPESLHHAHSVVHPTRQVVGARPLKPVTTRAQWMKDIFRFGRVRSAKGGDVGKIFGVSPKNVPALSPVGLKSPLAALPPSELTPVSPTERADIQNVVPATGVVINKKKPLP